MFPSNSLHASVGKLTGVFQPPAPLPKSASNSFKLIKMHIKLMNIGSSLLFKWYLLTTDTIQHKHQERG